MKRPVFFVNRLGMFFFHMGLADYIEGQGYFLGEFFIRELGHGFCLPSLSSQGLSLRPPPSH